MEYLIFLVIALVAAIVSGAIGILWYSKKMFGKAWLAEAGQKIPEASMKKHMMRSMLKGLLIDFITNAVFLLLLISFRHANPFVLAGFLWLGFIAPNIASASVYEGRSWKIFWITSIYRFIGLLPMSIIFFLLAR